MISMSYLAWVCEFMKSYEVDRRRLLLGTGLEDSDPTDLAGEMTDASATTRAGPGCSRAASRTFPSARRRSASLWGLVPELFECAGSVSARLISRRA